MATNGKPIFSFVDKEPVQNGQKKEKPLNEFLVFRKRRFFGIPTGEKQFCVCNEVNGLDDIVSCVMDGQVVAILLKKDFSCALSLKLFQDEEI